MTHENDTYSLKLDLFIAWKKNENWNTMKELSIYMGMFSATKFRVITHYENVPIQIYWKFYHQKMKIFR